MQPVRELFWRAADQADPIEVITRRQLVARFPLDHFESVERLQFHMVMIGDSGVGTHEIDFVDHPVVPRRVLHVEPGQVHRWTMPADFEATLVLFRDVPDGLTQRWKLGPAIVDLDPSERDGIQTVLDLIDEEQRNARSPVAREVVLRSLRDLLFVRLGLDHARTATGHHLPAAYAAFRTDLESSLSVAATMEQRADRIGYSTRTISRACVEVSGRTAKQLADERIVLEACRLLSQPGSTSAQVADAIGFTEQTNFAKYFRRHTSLTPSAWIASVRPSRTGRLPAVRAPA